MATFMQLPAEFTLVECDPKELMVAGVYVRLFIHNTSWSLRRPVEFLTECLDRLCTLLDKDQPQVFSLSLSTPPQFCGEDRLAAIELSVTAHHASNLYPLPLSLSKSCRRWMISGFTREPYSIKTVSLSNVLMAMWHLRRAIFLVPQIGSKDSWEMPAEIHYQCLLFRSE